jgi:hypothetical protein
MRWLTDHNNTLNVTPAETGSTSEAYARYRRDYRLSWLLVVAPFVAMPVLASLPAWIRPALYFLEFAGICTMGLAYIRYVSTWDELQQRLLIGAAAAALALTIVALVFNMILKKLAFPSLDAGPLALVPLVAFFICNVIARMRYA